MLTIQTTFLRCWLSFIAFPAINNIVAKLRKQRPTVATEPVQVQPAAEEAEDTIVIWDTQRGEKLQEAVDCEHKGLRLLAKATLLRVAIQCDDRGDISQADELRERARILDSQNVDALSAEEVWQPTELRIYDADDLPAKCGA